MHIEVKIKNNKITVRTVYHYHYNEKVDKFILDDAVETFENSRLLTDRQSQQHYIINEEISTPVKIEEVKKEDIKMILPSNLTIIHVEYDKV